MRESKYEYIGEVEVLSNFQKSCCWCYCCFHFRHFVKYYLNLIVVCEIPFESANDRDGDRARKIIRTINWMNDTHTHTDRRMWIYEHKKNIEKKSFMKMSLCLSKKPARKHFTI